MMRLALVGVAVFTLAACETGPVAAQPTGTVLSAPVQTNATPMQTYGPPPDQQLLDLERRLSATAQDRGLGGAYGSVIDPTDGFVMRPGTIYQGAEAVEHGLMPPPNAGPLIWQPDRVFVSQGGDMGMTSGRYVQVVRGAEAIQGRYVAVWRRDASGQWKLLSETRQADPPRTAAAAAPARRRAAATPAAAH